MVMSSFERMEFEGGGKQEFSLEENFVESLPRKEEVPTRESDNIRYRFNRNSKLLASGIVLGLGLSLTGCSEVITKEVLGKSQNEEFANPRASQVYGEDLLPSQTVTEEGDVLLSDPVGPQYTEEIQEEEIQEDEVEEEIGVEEVEVDKVFNRGILDIEQWSGFSTEQVEKKEPGYIVNINEPTFLYAVPLTKDGFYRSDRYSNYTTILEEISLTEKHSFEIAEIKTIVGPNGERINLGLLRNSFTYNSNFAYAVLLGAEDAENNILEFATEDEIKKSSVSYISPVETISPNKVANVLVGLEKLSSYQENNGPFVAGRQYSALDILGLSRPGGFGDYLLEKNIRANGVCSIATALSSLSHMNGNEIVERWGHPRSEMYQQGPFGLDSRTVDAAINIDMDSVFDFKWIQNEDLYIQVSVDIVPGEAVSEDGVSLGLALVVSFSYTTQEPEGQAEHIQQKLEDYARIENLALGSEKKGVSEVGGAVSLVYDREDISMFADIIENDPVLRDILELQKAVNSYDEDSGQTLSQHLRASEWYTNYLENFPKEGEELRLAEYAISAVDHVRIKGQPLQCVMYAAMLAHLYPELGIQYIGGTMVTEADGTTRGLQAASELVFPGFSGITRGSPAGGLQHSGKDVVIEDFEGGDLFVLMGKFGHVGVISAKLTDESGKTWLLVTDANRLEDGRVRTFVVGEGGMDDVFGEHRYRVFSFKE
jgi:hypothetical protein